MNQVNNTFTQPSEFVIVGFPGIQPEYYNLTAWLFLFLYVITVGGNSLLVVLFAVEHSLQKPMYIIMVSLALSDIGYSTVGIPKLIARYWWDDGAIGFTTCLFQKQMLHYFGTLNSLIMMTMALDRYLAICFPFLYPKIMTNKTMTGLTLVSWVLAHIAPAITSFQSAELPFCGSNRIISCFCDTQSLNTLACVDVSPQTRVSFTVAMFVLLVPFSFILFSYVHVIVVMTKIKSTQGRWKAFSTCSCQLFIISLYYVPRCCAYTINVIGVIQLSVDLRMGLMVFYSLLPPLLNPFIYCFRTKEIRLALTRWGSRGQPVGRKASVATVGG